VGRHIEILRPSQTALRPPLNGLRGALGRAWKGRSGGSYTWWRQCGYVATDYRGAGPSKDRPWRVRSCGQLPGPTRGLLLARALVGASALLPASGCAPRPLRPYPATVPRPSGPVSERRSHPVRGEEERPLPELVLGPQRPYQAPLAGTRTARATDSDVQEADPGA
jgi:hypothetical protein